MDNIICRALCLVLCVLLAVQVIPATVFATEGGGTGLYDQLQTDDFYGRSVLETMENSDALLYAYDKLAEGIDHATSSVEVYNGENPISVDEISMVMDVVIRDYMGDFWYDGRYSVSYNNKTVVKVKPSYNLSGADLKNAIAEFKAATGKILSGLKAGMTDYEKELYLHDQVASVVSYKDVMDAHNAYGALVKGEAVCDGYAKAFGYLLQCCGIQSFVAYGTAEDRTTGQRVGHAWNYVRIGDHYHQTDVTWDDQENELFHAYFNETDSIMREDHEAYPTVYQLPGCEDCNDFYFTDKPELLVNYTVESVASLLKNNGYKDHVYIPGDTGAFTDWLKENIANIAEEMGVTGTFSYMYIQLGREFHLEIILPGGAPVSTNVSGVIQSIGDAEELVNVALCKDGQPIMSLTVPASGGAYCFENVQPGEYTLEITCDGFINVTFSVTAGTGNVEQDARIYRQGDINGDGKVNNKDVTRLMQSLASWDVDAMEGAQDVNGDGKVNNKDVTRLMQYLAGWDVKIYM